MSIGKWLISARLAWEEARDTAVRAFRPAAVASPPNAIQLENRVLLSVSPVAIVADGDATGMDGQSKSLIATITDAEQSDLAESSQASADEVRTADDGLALLDTLVDELLPAADARANTDPSGSLLDDPFVEIDDLIVPDADVVEVVADDSRYHDATDSPLDVVLIDSTLSDVDILADAVESGAFVITYDGANSSIAAVLADVEATAVAHQSQIASMTILSHGSIGQFDLGNELVTTTMTAEQQQAWRQVAGQMATGANIYVYGCNVADSGAGQELLDSLAALTGADIFSSTDTTGVSGDWELEAASVGDAAELATGLSIPLDLARLQTYRHDLTVPDIIARVTLDSDADGQIDQIKITTDMNLDDDFGGLTMTVSGYIVTGYWSDVANDNIFYVNLSESGTPDTGATPDVVVTANATLSEDGGTHNIATENAWWNTDWQNRTKITFDNTNSGENLTDFPVLVRLDLSNVDFAKIKAGGAEFRFVDDDGTLLDYEIEDWDDTPGSESAAVWVKVQQIDAGVQQQHEIVFVDTAVHGYQQLVVGITADAAHTVDVVLIDASRDGITQITQTLAGQHDLSAVHIISYGADGKLLLGTAQLDTDALLENAAQIKDWGDALTEKADLMLYGCNVAQDATGQAFVQQLSALTGADVAASSNLTGQSTLGGDWVLEHHAGPVETAVAIDAATQQAWVGLLDIYTGQVGHWRFDADAGDSSGNGNDGTLTNGASIDTTAGTNKVGSGKLFLDGVDDYVDLTSRVSSFSGLTQGTMSAWIKTTPNDRIILESVDAADDYSGVYFRINNSGNLVFEVYENQTPLLRVKTTAVVADSSWHHVVVTVDAGGNKLYVDGVQAAVTYSTGNASSNMFFDDTTNLSSASIGRDVYSTTQTGWYFVGNIDDLRVYDRALTASEISQLANLPPENTVPGAQAVNEDTNLVFSSANGNPISIEDADAGSNPVEATLSVGNGTLTLGGTSGLTFTEGDGTADVTMTFRGTVIDITNGLNGLVYTPTGNYSGGDTLTLRTVDSALVSLNIESMLKGYYTFDNTGDLGNDSSLAGAYDGTVSGATSVNDATRGNVLSFDGNDYVQMSGHFGNPANVTLAAWVNLTAADTGGAEVISLGDSCALRLDDASGLKGFIYNGTTWKPVTYATTLAGTGWHHVAYIFNDAANVHKLYLDGVEVAALAETGSISYTRGANSTIGSYNNGNSSFDFNGKIDDARVYSRALTASEIASLASDSTLSDTDTVSITVNPVDDAPLLAGIEGTNLAYTENGAASAVTSTITASDVDNTNLASATIQITGNYQNGQDVLSFTDTSNITGSWNVTNGTLTLSGADTVANYQAALRAVKYQNTSDNPSGATRTVSFTVSDGAANSNTLTRDIAVTPVNDAPSLDLDADDSSGKSGADFAAVFTEKGGAVLIADSDATLSDADSANLQSLSVEITNLLDGASEVLSANTAGTSIAANYDSGTGILTLSGADTVANYQQVLRTVSYNNTSENPTTTDRSITVMTNDGTDDSNIGTTTLTMVAQNDTPVITSDGGGDSASAIILENTTYITTVTATDSEGDTPTYSISGGVDAARFQIDTNTGVLSFASSPDFEAPADANANNVYEVVVAAHDGNGGTDTQSISVTVSDGNEAPTLVNNALTLAEGESVTLTATELSAMDPDNADSSLVFNLTNVTGGRFELSSAPGVAITGFTQGQITAGDVIFVHDGNEFAASYEVTADDGLLQTGPDAAAVSFTNVNDIPVAVADAFEINNDQTLTVTLPGILGNDSDVDSPALTAILVSGPNHGTLTFQPDGSFVYSPDAAHDGLDGFTYRASDGSDDSQPVTVSILVHVVVGPPDNTLPEDNASPIENDDPPSESAPPTEPESPSEEIPESDDAGPLDSVDGANSTPNQTRESIVRSTEGSSAASDDEAENNGVSDRAPGSQYLSTAWTNRSGSSGPVAGSSVQESSYRLASLPVHTGQSGAMMLWDKCVATQHEMASADMTNALSAGTAVVVSGALTVGYIVWMLRSGFFVASCMSSVPAWMSFDPLPILESGSMAGATAAEADEKDQSLVELVGGGELAG